MSDGCQGGLAQAPGTRQSGVASPSSARPAGLASSRKAYSDADPSGRRANMLKEVLPSTLAEGEEGQDERAE
jgi:hypothetical protein